MVAFLRRGSSPRRRVRYNVDMRFSLRDLFWLTLVVSISVCWGLHVAKLKNDTQQRIAEIKRQFDELEKLIKTHAQTAKHNAAAEIPRFPSTDAYDDYLPKQRTDRFQ
jgi:hypothetical protein